MTGAARSLTGGAPAPAGARPLRVTQLLYSGLGGHGAVALPLAEAGARRGWAPSLGFFGVEPLLPAYAAACRTGAFPFAYFGAVPGRSWTAWPRIYRWLDEVRPDVVLVHSVTSLLPCWLYARRRQARLVVVEHQANALKHRVHRAHDRAAMRLADDVVVLTPAYEDELRQRLGRAFQAAKVRVIPSGVDTAVFSPRTPGARPDARAVRLGMASRFTPIKRHDVLVGMLARLRHLAPRVPWHLSLAGDGESLATVRDAVGRAGLSAVVELPGHLDGRDLARWYRSLDVYVHASSGETLSTALLQAMASGLPIVASDVPGIAPLLGGEPPCGVLVPGDDPARFAEAVRAVVEAPDAAAALGATARTRVEALFAPDAMFEAYDAVARGTHGGR